MFSHADSHYSWPFSKSLSSLLNVSIPSNRGLHVRRIGRNTRSNSLSSCLLLITPEGVRALAGRDPLAAFRIAQAQLLNSSRQGNMELSQLWGQTSNDLVEKINADAPGMDFNAGHINRRIVIERHGRYDFRPELPQQAMDMVERLLELNGLKKRCGSGAVAMALGKLYGTIAQNFGFCGVVSKSELFRDIFVIMRYHRREHLKGMENLDTTSAHFGYLELRALHEIARVLARPDDLKDQLQQTLDILSTWLGMERGMISILDLQTGKASAGCRQGGGCRGRKDLLSAGRRHYGQGGPDRAPSGHCQSQQ